MTSRTDSGLLRRGSHGNAVADVRQRLRALPDHLAHPLDPQDAPGHPDRSARHEDAERARNEQRDRDLTAGDIQDYDLGLERAVRAFQQQQGLIVDGIIGPETFAALDGARWRLGDRILLLVPEHLMQGEDVFALQKQLSSLGFACGRVDGRFGTATDGAVRAFQRAYGLQGDGTVGPETLRAFAGLQRSVAGGSASILRESERVRRAGHSLSGRTVVLDPGHGDGSPGAASGGLVEGELVLDLARRIEARLTAIGTSVVFTRSALTNPSEEERAEVANRVGADVLLSLHCDSHEQRDASGVATFFFGRERGVSWSGVGEELADLIQREVVARTGLADCRSHARSWTLLRRTTMPAVRVEAGYLTHGDDARRLSDPAFRDTLAEAVVVALQRVYLGEDDMNATGMLRVGDLRAAIAQMRALS